MGMTGSYLNVGGLPRDKRQHVRELGHVCQDKTNLRGCDPRDAHHGEHSDNEGLVVRVRMKGRILWNVLPSSFPVGQDGQRATSGLSLIAIRLCSPDRYSTCYRI